MAQHYSGLHILLIRYVLTAKLLFALCSELLWGFFLWPRAVFEPPPIAKTGSLAARVEKMKLKLKLYFIISGPNLTSLKKQPHLNAYFKP